MFYKELGQQRLRLMVSLKQQCERDHNDRNYSFILFQMTEALIVLMVENAFHKYYITNVPHYTTVISMET